MKLLRLALIAMIAFIPASIIHAQTADEIIGKHIDAVGGKDLLMKITSIYSEGTGSVMGMEFPTKTTVLVGKGFRSESTVNGTDIVQVITDTSGWMLNPMTGQTEATPMPADAVKLGRSSYEVGGDLFNFKDKGFSDSLAGREMVDNVNAYKIKLSKADLEIVYYIDPTTYYLLKTDTKASVGGQDVNSTTTFSNYKKTDFGFTVPYTMGISNNGFDITLNYSKVEINKDVDPKIFLMPTK